MENQNQLTAENNSQLQLKQQREVSKELDLMNEQVFGQAWRVAQVFAKGNIPISYRGKPEAVMVAMVRARSLGIDIFYLMDHSFELYGKIGMDGQLITALLNDSPAIEGSVWYDVKRNSNNQIVSCTAFAEKVIKPGKTREVSFCVDSVMVRENGWDCKKDKNGNLIKSLWNTTPELMYRYRSATYLGRTEFPQVIGGLRLREEIEEQHHKELMETEFSIIGDGGELKTPEEKNEKKPMNSRKKKEKKSPPQEDNKKIKEETIVEPQPPEIDILNSVATSKSDLKRKRTALMNHIKISIQPTEEHTFSEYLVEIKFLPEGETDYRKLPDNAINVVARNINEIIQRYKEKDELRQKFLGAVISACPSYDEQDQLNQYMIQNKLKEGGDKFANITLKELQKVIPMIQEIIKQFKASNVVNEQPPHPGDQEEPLF